MCRMWRRRGRAALSLALFGALVQSTGASAIGVPRGELQQQSPAQQQQQQPPQPQAQPEEATVLERIRRRLAEDDEYDGSQKNLSECAPTHRLPC